MAILVYIDDIVVAGNDSYACNEFKNYLNTYLASNILAVEVFSWD